MSVDQPSPVALLYRASTSTDAIAAYCARLESALEETGVAARMLAWNGAGIDVPAGHLIVQYNPFSFGRWGFAPRLVADLASLRRRRTDVRVAVMVHEPFVPVVSAKTLVLGAWQRLQLRTILSLADTVLVSTSSWNRLLPARRQGITAPAGSNLPDRRDMRISQRRALGAEPETIVLATFGTGHPARLIGPVVAAANAIAADDRRVILLVLGTGGQELDDLDPAVVVRRPGRQSPDELAAELSGADIYLAAFVDGLSTRRTTLMAALQHALPVVGSDGPLSEPELRREVGGITWTATGDTSAFAGAAVALAGRSDHRLQRGVAARELYDRRFSWPRIADVVIDALSSPSRGGGSRR